MLLTKANMERLRDSHILQHVRDSPASHQTPLVLRFRLLHYFKGNAIQKWLELFTILIVHIV